MNKYRNVKTEIDGIVFDSRKEANRYRELRLLEKAGEIQGLVVQPCFVITVNGSKVCSYKADFRYEQINRGKDGLRVHGLTNVVEDVKSEATRRLPVYRLKKKLLKAVHGIDVVEV